MKLIEQNPFRILGIPVNASARDLAANKGKMRLLDIGRDVSFPLDLPGFFPSITRTQESVTTAEREINLPQDKIKHALFWFAQPTEPIGKLAYDHLMQGNNEKAQELLSKCHSWEALLCRSVLELQTGRYGDALLNFYSLSNGQSGLMCHAIAGQTFEMNASELIRLYVKTLSEEVEAPTLLQEWGKYSELPDGSEVIEIELRNIAIEKPLDTIEKEIAACKAVSTDNTQAQLEAGKKLANNTHKIRIQLQKLVGNDDPRYGRVVDKLANQILQCSINYFNKTEGENREIIENALKLGEYALKIAVGKMARDHIQHNVDILRKKKDNLPPAGLEKHDAAIKAKILELVLINGRTIDNAIKTMKDCAPHIVVIKELSAIHKTYYLDISTQLVSAVLSSVIKEYKEVTNKLGPQLQNSYTRASALSSLKDILKRAWKATLMMDKFDVDDNFKKKRYTATRKALAEMYDNVFGSYSSSISSISNSELDLRTEDEYYNGCRTSSDFLSFMGKYPRSKHLDEAQQRYNRLKIEEEKKRKEREEKERRERLEREADDNAFKSCTTISDYQSYLRNYPNGRHSSEAIQKIKELKGKITSIISVVIVELIWLIIGIAVDDYDTNWWVVFLGGGIGGWFAYVNFLAFCLFSWIISKLIDNEE